MKQVFTLSWTVDNSFEGVAVREFLKEHDISKASLTDIKFRGGAIEVNGKHATVRYILQKGDEIKVAFPPEKQVKVFFLKLYLWILYTKMSIY